MTNINNLFFQLIQVALGFRVCLSHTPTAEEWRMLYEMAKKQSLVGVCFAGVQRLQQQRQEPPEMLYLTWMGMAAKIQQRNEVVNQRCIELQNRMASEGVNSVIMKGQGIAMLYSDELCGLRQSGDIDVWVLGGFDKTIEVARKIGRLGKYSYVHAEWDVFEDTEVELHYRPSSMRNLINNHRFQKWAESFGKDAFEVHNGIVTPPLAFNRIYLLLHCYRHVIGAGIGLRQLMDYYFCLKCKELSVQEKMGNEMLLKRFGLYRFAGAVMYVLAEVFHLDEKFMICDPNKKEGDYLLMQTLIGGNFGRYDERVKNNETDSSIARKLFMNLRYALHYPGELLWAPVWRVYATCWKLINKIS